MKSTVLLRAAIAIIVVMFLASSSTFAQRLIRGSGIELDDQGVGPALNTIQLLTPSSSSLTSSYVLTLPTGLPAAGANGLLRSNSSGQLSWMTVSPADNGSILTVVGGDIVATNPTSLTTLWSTGGNTGLTAGSTNFFGTRDNVGLNFITNGTGNVRMSIEADGSVRVYHSLELVGGNTPLLMNGTAGTAGSVLTSNGPGLTPTWQAPASGPFWAVGGNTAPASTLLGNNATNGDLDLVAGGVARLNISGATGAVTFNNGLRLSDGATHNATINPATLAANHNYRLPNIGATTTTGDVAVATGQGTAGSVLVSQGANAPAQWQTVPAMSMVRGIADPVDGSFQITISPGVALSATSTIMITHVSSIGGGAFVSTITPGTAGVASFTVTLPGAAAASDIIHWMVIP